MVAHARAWIAEVEIPDLIARLANPDLVVVDIRDVREPQRGVTEFWMDQKSPYFTQVFGPYKEFVRYCALGWPLALTTLLDTGFKAAQLREGLFAGAAQGRPVDRPD